MAVTNVKKRLSEYMRDEKNRKELFKKLKDASCLPENGVFKLQLTALIEHCDYIDRLYDNGSYVAVHALILIEDVLDRKLTHEEFNHRLAETRKDESPIFAKLSLLLAAFGVVLVAAGFLMGGAPLIAAGAIAQATVASGILCTITGGVGFFRYNPSRISTLSDDFGNSYYNAISSN